MTINLTMAVVVGGLYAAGFHLLLQRSLMRVLLGIVVLGHGANLLLQIAGGPPAPPPVDVAAGAASADPLPQALALTAIVITFALTTFLLALGYRSSQLLGHDDVQDDVEDRRIGQRDRPDAGLDPGAGTDERRAAEEIRTDDETGAVGRR